MSGPSSPNPRLTSAEDTDPRSAMGSNAADLATRSVLPLVAHRASASDGLGLILGIAAIGILGVVTFLGVNGGRQKPAPQQAVRTTGTPVEAAIARAAQRTRRTQFCCVSSGEPNPLCGGSCSVGSGMAGSDTSSPSISSPLLPSFSCQATNSPPGVRHVQRREVRLAGSGPQHQWAA